jgi:type I restriction enzyme M protein
VSALDAFVSLAAIARAAEVRPAAVSMWRHRGQGFPAPERIEGQDLFSTTAVAQFLDGRRIPRNTRKEGEPVGTTYGERFRRNLGLPRFLVQDATAQHATDRSERSEKMLERNLWQALDKYRGAADLGTYMELLLGMLVLCSNDHARWAELVRAVELPHHRGGITELLDRAMRAHEEANPDLRGALPDVSPRVWEDRHLAAIIRLLNRIVTRGGLEDKRLTAAPAAVVCRFLLARFATSEGLRGGEFYTPAHLVRIMVQLTAPRPTEQICDPCCGSGDTLVGTAGHVEQYVGSSGPTVSGQALSARSWRLAKLNLAIHGIAADLGSHPANALLEDLHTQRRFDVVLTNPPFNMSGWSDGRAAADPRWRYGVPPEHNANFAWLQHVTSMLSERGRAAVLMANGASASQNPRERVIRAAMVDDGVVDCIIALPPKLFQFTAISVTLWLLKRPSRQKNPEVLFVDATATGSLVDRSHQILTDEDTDRIVSTYNEWRSRRKSDDHEGIAGFSRCVSVEQIRERGYVLNPRRYVSTPTVSVDKENAAEALQRLAVELQRLHTQSEKVDAHVEQALRRVGVWRP